ncbi:MAG: NTP transferase domain-containing protein [Planctomycetota bacterium]
MKALIPAAGRGTRMAALTGGSAKELYPLAGLPMIAHALRELAAAGLSEVGVITSPVKGDLDRCLTGQAPPPGIAPQKAAEFARIIAPFEFAFFVQDEPRGLADALLEGADWVDDDAFLLILPDGVVVPPETSLSPLLEAHRVSGDSVFALIEVRREEAERYGNCGGVTLAGGDEPARRILTLQEKGKGHFQVDGESALRTFPRQILSPRFFEIARDLHQTHLHGEFDDVPILRMLVDEGGVLGQELTGRGFDVGNPVGHAAAEKALA